MTLISDKHCIAETTWFTVEHIVRSEVGLIVRLITPRAFTTLPCALERQGQRGQWIHGVWDGMDGCCNVT